MPPSVTRVKSGPALLRIGLSDGALFSLNPFYLPLPYQGGDYFFPGREITGEEDAALRFAAECYRAERAALRLVARAEQCRAGLKHKLEQRGHGGGPADAALAYLADLGLLDDRRFAGRWILARIRRGAESPLGLIRGLCRRGIDQGIAREARETVLDLDTETELLGRFIAKKHGAPGNAPDLRFLRARLRREGFSTAVLERYWDEHF